MKTDNTWFERVDLIWMVAIAAVLCAGMTCKPPPKPAAGTAGTSALPGAIAASNSNHVAALQAVAAVAADAAASVSAIAGANSAQPASLTTEFIDAEAKLAENSYVFDKSKPSVQSKHRAKLSFAQKGVKKTADHCANISAGMLGKSHPPERIAAARDGRRAARASRQELEAA